MKKVTVDGVTLQVPENIGLKLMGSLQRQYDSSVESSRLARLLRELSGDKEPIAIELVGATAFIDESGEIGFAKSGNRAMNRADQREKEIAATENRRSVRLSLPEDQRRVATDDQVDMLARDMASKATLGIDQF